MVPARPRLSPPIAVLLVTSGVFMLPGCGGERPQRLAGTIHVSRKSTEDRFEKLPPHVQAKLPKSTRPTTKPAPQTTPQPTSP